jgi:hypothetical protein
MSIDQYSATPASNDLANYFETGMRPSAVKNAGWDIMADLASYMVSLPAASGTANALTAANGRPFGALTAGLLQVLNPTAVNTGPATFAPDGLAAEPIFTNGAALAGGEMQPGVPAALKYDGTQWNLLNPVPAGKNLFVDPCCRVAQGAALALVAGTYGYGLVDLVQGQVTGTVVSAGTLTQDASYTVAAAATAYSTKIAGLTVTGTGKVLFRKWIESRDAVALKNGYCLFSVLCRHDIGSSINAFLTVNAFQTQDSRGAPVQIATGSGSPVSVVSGTDTLVTLAVPNMSAGGATPANGIEVILEMDCGAVTSKDLWATDWQACIKTLAQKCGVPRFEDDLAATQRYFEKSYEYGTAPGTATNNGRSECITVSTRSNGALVPEMFIRMTRRKVITPVPIAYSPATGASGEFRDIGAGTDKAATLAANTTTVELTNGGAQIAATDQIEMHWTADARL